MTNSKSTKRALITSALAMLMCVAMLIGTTFAWFTDTASTAVNKIQSGKLDVALVDESGNSLEGTTLKWSAFDNREQSEILWEPGCTYKTQEFYIENKGNLNLKFKVLVSGIDGDAKLLDVTSFTAMAKANQFHFNTGAISITPGDDEEFDLLKGYELNTYFYGTKTFTEYTLEPGDKVGPIAISGHMDENAGNEYQNLSIDGIGITIIATQGTGEEDSYNGTYDEKAAYSVTAQQWTASFTNGATVTVDTPTAIDGKADTATGEVNPDSEPVLNNAGNVELNLQNTVTSGNLSGNTWGVMRVMPGTTLTITGDENGKFINTKSESIVNVNGGNVVVNNGYFESNSNIFFYYTDSDSAIGSMSLTINGGTYKAEGDVVYNPAGLPITGIVINGGTFYGWDPSAYVDANHTVTTSTEGSTTIYTVAEN